MKVFSRLLIAVLLPCAVLSISNPAHAGVYNCVAISLTAQGPTLLGHMKVDVSQAKMEQITWVTQGDFCACGGTDPKKGPQDLLCDFGNNGNQPSTTHIVRDARTHLWLAYQTNQRTGQIQTMPIAATRDNSPELDLILPGSDGQEVFVVQCTLAP